MMPADWSAQLVGWLPVIALVVVAIFLARIGRTRWGRVQEFQEAQVAEMQRTNALLNRIAVALEKRAETSAQR
jgi:hypothetical protein